MTLQFPAFSGNSLHIKIAPQPDGSTLYATRVDSTRHARPEDNSLRIDAVLPDGGHASTILDGQVDVFGLNDGQAGTLPSDSKLRKNIESMLFRIVRPVSNPDERDKLKELHDNTRFVDADGRVPHKLDVDPMAQLVQQLGRLLSAFKKSDHWRRSPDTSSMLLGGIHHPERRLTQYKALPAEFNLETFDALETNPVNQRS